MARPCTHWRGHAPNITQQQYPTVFLLLLLLLLLEWQVRSCDIAVRPAFQDTVTYQAIMRTVGQEATDSWWLLWFPGVKPASLRVLVLARQIPNSFNEARSVSLAVLNCFNRIVSIGNSQTSPGENFRAVVLKKEFACRTEHAGSLSVHHNSTTTKTRQLQQQQQ